MHVHMIPTLISTVDQIEMSSWSYVALWDDPRLMMYCSRMMLTTVTLGMLDANQDADSALTKFQQ